MDLRPVIALDRRNRPLERLRDARRQLRVSALLVAGGRLRLGTGVRLGRKRAGPRFVLCLWHLDRRLVVDRSLLGGELGVVCRGVRHRLSSRRSVRAARSSLGRPTVQDTMCVARGSGLPFHPDHQTVKAIQSLLSGPFPDGVPVPDPDKRRELVSIEGEVPSLNNRPSGCEFHTRCRYAQARCRSEAPGYRELSPGHGARCHFPLNQ